jgi:pilus assembly protein CpaE
MDAVMKRPVDIVALLRSAEARESLRKILSEDSASARILTMPAHFVLADLRALRGDVLIIDVDVTSATEMAAIGQFVADENSPPVVATTTTLDVNAMRAIMRLGVPDVIQQPFEHADVAATLQVALDRRRTGLTHAKRGSVTSFIGSGGGVGVTSLAVHGACAVTRGKDAPDLCLIDLDLQFGTAALLMDVDQRSSIVDLVRDPARLDGALLRGSMIRAKDRFDLLAAPADVQPQDLDPVALASTLAIARSQYARTIIDVPRLWSQWTYTVLEMSSVIVLVVQLAVPSLRLARRQLDWLNREGLGHTPLVVVANRVESGLFKKRLSSADAEKALGRKIDHLIPDEPAFQAAADVGLPIGDASGGGSVEKKLATMMKDIFQRDQSLLISQRT